MFFVFKEPEKTDKMTVKVPYAEQPKKIEVKEKEKICEEVKDDLYSTRPLDRSNTTMSTTESIKMSPKKSISVPLSPK